MSNNVNNNDNVVIISVMAEMKENAANNESEISWK